MNRYITCITLSYTEFCKYISVRYAILYLNPIDPQRKNYLSHLEETAPQSTSVEHEIYAKELLSLMDTTIASLPPQKRTIFNMSRKEGLSNDEIALRLNLKKNTVEKTISFVLTQLKKNMLAALLFLIP